MAVTARTNVDVNLGTVEAIEEILSEAGVPVSRYYIRQALSQAGRATTPARLNRALGFLFDHALAVEGSKGIQWTHSGSESLRRAALLGRRL